MIFKTIVKRIIDAVLMWMVWQLCMEEYYYLVDDMETRYRLIYADSFDFFKVILILSLIIGVVQIIAIKKGWMKGPEKSTLSMKERFRAGMKGFSVILLRAVILFVVALFFGKWLSEHPDLPRKTYHTIYLVYLVVLSLCLQAVVMGRKCMFGKLLYWISYGIVSIFTVIVGALGGTIAIIVGFIGVLSEILGKRIMLGILELVICVLSCLLVFGIGVKMELIQDYEKDRTYSFSEWYDENDDLSLFDKLDLDPEDDGWFGRLYDSEISSFTYYALNSYSVWCGLAGIILMVLGQGIIGILCHKLLGWNDAVFQNYEETHENRWIRTYDSQGNASYYWGNGNPHGVVWLFLLIFSFVISIVGGIFIPICIVGNFAIGIIQLIVRGVCNAVANGAAG